MSGTKSLNSLYPKRIDIPILTAVSGILLLIGLAKPVITVQKLWDSNTQSILSSVINLWKDTDYFLAAVIFFFSMIFSHSGLFHCGKIRKKHWSACSKCSEDGQCSTCLSARF